MNRIIQGLALAVVASAAHAAPGDAYPAGSASYYLISPQNHAATNLRGADTQAVRAYPSSMASYYLVSKQTHADMHAGDANTRTVTAFPADASSTGD
jgi:hypothetical protein